MRLAIVSLALTLTATLIGARAHAQPASPSKQSCAESHAKAQELRLDSKLLEARSELHVCADLACPSALSTDCANWLAEVQQAIPSVVFLVEAETGDTSNVKISVDGQPVTQTADGTAHEFEPGAHLLRFELPDYPAEEQTLVLRQGEKRRVLRVRFEKPRPVDPSPTNEAEGSGVATSGTAPGEATRPVPLTAYIFGGIALAAAGVGTYLGLDAIAEQEDKENACAPNCADADVDQLKTQLLVADAAGAVAVISAGIAAYVFFTRPVVVEEPPASALRHVRISVAPNTLGLALSGAF